MNSPKLHGIYTAQFPFLDTSEVKIRPVIVISPPIGKYNAIAVVLVSAKATPENVDVVLKHWKSENLLKPSVARVHRLTTMLQADLLAELGSLTKEDAKQLQDSLRKFLRL